MKTVYADKHVLHAPIKEISCGQIVDCAEKSSRADNLHAAVKAAGFGPVIAPKAFSEDKILRIHDPAYVDFLKTAHEDWVKAGYTGDAFATNFNIQHNSKRAPKAIEGKTGFYMADTSVAITPGTWAAAEQACHAALTGLELVMGGEGAAYALNRPPGHHATAAAACGYSFINYAAVSAQAAIDAGAKKVAILDIDYHHGNGTQDIFYERGDVLYCSLHADPAMDFPYFLGYADETGRGAGAGFNRNYPLPLGTAWDTYGPALEDALKHIAAFGADLLIVSLGVDTYEKDPISFFKIRTDDYARMGGMIADMKKATLFIQEGGYAIDDIGTNVVSALSGFLDRR